MGEDMEVLAHAKGLVSAFHFLEPDVTEVWLTNTTHECYLMLGLDYV